MKGRLLADLSTLAGWVSPWLAEIVTRFPFSRRVSLFMDRMILFSEGSEHNGQSLAGFSS